MISGNEWLAPMAESNGILMFAFTLLTLFLVRLLHVFYNTGKALKSTCMKPRSTLIVLGSGGHTAEMLNLLSVLQKDRFMPRYYVAAATDNMSLQKAQTLESSSNNTQFLDALIDTIFILRHPEITLCAVDCGAKAVNIQPLALQLVGSLRQWVNVVDVSPP